MNKKINTQSKEWLALRLTLLLCLVFIVVMLIVWPSYAPASGSLTPMVPLGAVKEDDHEDIDENYDGTEDAWILLPKEVPELREIILVTDRTTVTEKSPGKLVEHISTGTNDFYISVWLEADGWHLSPGYDELKDTDGNGYQLSSYYSTNSHKEFLLSALEKKWDLRMEIPDEVSEKLNEGYIVGVSASDVQNFVAGPEYEKLDQLTMDTLFYLNKPLRYMFEDQYLYIKCWPKIHMRENLYYNK